MSPMWCAGGYRQVLVNAPQRPDRKEALFRGGYSLYRPEQLSIYTEVPTVDDTLLDIQHLSCGPLGCVTTIEKVIKDF